jgi:hypothetical protein
MEINQRGKSRKSSVRNLLRPRELPTETVGTRSFSSESPAYPWPWVGGVRRRVGLSLGDQGSRSDLDRSWISSVRREKTLPAGWRRESGSRLPQSMETSPGEVRCSDKLFGKSLRMNQFCGNSETSDAFGDLGDSKHFAAFTGVIVSPEGAVRGVI